MLIATGQLVLLGCGPGGPLRTRLHAEVERPARGALLFIADGVSVDLLRQGCRAGWLPNIQRRFVAGGTTVQHAVTVFPTITYGVLTTYATGLTPATHNVPGNRWFDREARLHRNYGVIKHYRAVNGDFAQPTIYERLQPAATASIQNAIKRGVTHNFANWAVSGTMWFFGNYTAVDKLTATTIERVARWANSRREWPTLLTCYFPGGDSIGHLHGASSRRYREAVEHVDHQIGRVCDWLEREGLVETTYLVFVSDHGMVDVEERVDLTGFLRKEWGRAVTDKPIQDGSMAQRKRYFGRFDTVVAYGSGRFANVHFAGAVGWDSVPEPDSVRALLEDPPSGAHLWDLPGVDMVVYALAENEIALRNRRGMSRIARRTGPEGPEYRYIPLPDDVCGYLEDAALGQFVAAGFHHERAWLRATAGQTYPDLVPHLGPLLRSPRVGQTMLFLAPGYSFDPERGGHGGLHRDEVCIPMMFAGPGIEAGGTLAFGRAVDVVPTLLELLGCEGEGNDDLDGQVLPLCETLGAEVVCPTP